MKRFSVVSAVSLVLSAVLCLSCLTACSGGFKTESAESDGIGAAANGAPDGIYDRSEQKNMYYGDANGGGGDSYVAGAVDAEYSRKVIRNAYFSLETKADQDTSALYDQLSAYCGSIGGHEFSHEINNSEKFSSVNAVLKIPPEKLDEFTAYIGESATVINSRVDSDDVTDEFYDLETRLETKRRSLERYYALLKDASSTDEIIQLQRTIDSITEDIEAAEGRLRVLSELVGMATVNLSIFQENDPARHDVEWGALSADDMGYYIKNGFIGLVSVIWGFIQWLAIILIVACPLWIPALIVLVIVFRRLKAKKAKRLAEIREKEALYIQEMQRMQDNHANNQVNYHINNQEEIPQENSEENQGENHEENE